MPIYRQINSASWVQESIPIAYYDADHHYAHESIVAHFGFGDIHICCAKSRNEWSDEIALVPSEVRPIGETGKVDGKSTLPPIRLLFDRRESIRVFIEELESLFKQFPDTENV